MTTLIAPIASVSSKNKELFEAMIQKYESQAKELDLTLDHDGRYHAPKGGIYFESTFYIGGQYVPFELNFPQGSAPSKAKIEALDFEIVKASLIGCSDISHGKIWENGGVKFCYIYFNAFRPSDIVKAIESYYEDKPKNLVSGVAPVGKRQVVAKVLSFRVDKTDYGVQTKMLVEFEDGAKAFGTAPKGDYAVGDKITFKAEFEKKDDSFSFFKRPTIIKQ